MMSAIDLVKYVLMACPLVLVIVVVAAVLAARKIGIDPDDYPFAGP